MPEIATVLLAANQSKVSEIKVPSDHQLREFALRVGGDDATSTINMEQFDN
jgi:hypothetical protein